MRNWLGDEWGIMSDKLEEKRIKLLREKADLNINIKNIKY